MDLDRVKKFLQSGRDDIEGWFLPLDQLAFYEIFSLQDRMGIKGDTVEVGVYLAKSLTLLSLMKNADERLIGLDCFEQDHEEVARKNLSTHGESVGVELIKRHTSELSSKSLDKLLQTPLRFLHIDAGHEYHEVLEQLILFTPYLRDSGIVAMDDYQDRDFPGIAAAVLDFAEIDRPRRFVPFLASGNKMFLCLASVATTLQKALVSQPNFENTCRLSRIKDFNVLIMASKLPVSSDKILSQLEGFNFPKKSEGGLTLNQKSATFSQLTFGAGT